MSSFKSSNLYWLARAFNLARLSLWIFLSPSNSTTEDCNPPLAVKIVVVTAWLVMGSKLRPVFPEALKDALASGKKAPTASDLSIIASVSYTHLRAHETDSYL